MRRKDTILTKGGHDVLVLVARGLTNKEIAERLQMSPNCRGTACCALAPKTGAKRALKRGAGFFLPGVWGCPPTLIFPQDWGIKEVEKRLIDNLAILRRAYNLQIVVKCRH